jgi:hypothetical protein
VTYNLFGTCCDFDLKIHWPVALEIIHFLLWVKDWCHGQVTVAWYLRFGVMLTKRNDKAATGTKMRRPSLEFRGRRPCCGMIHTSLQRLHLKRKQSFRVEEKGRLTSHLYCSLYQLPEFYRRTSLRPVSEVQGIYILEQWIILECSGMYL